MKKIIYFNIAAMILISTSLYAFSWDEHKFVVKSSKKSENETHEVVKNDKGITFSVRFYDKLSDEDGNKIISLNEEFRKWKYMVVKKVDFTVSNDVIEVDIIPSKFKYGKTNIIKHLPAGMMFISGENLRYNFRITQSNIFLRMKGKFTSEEALCKNLAEAIRDPFTYLKKRDPDYFLKKLTELEDAFKNIKKEYDILKEEYDMLKEEHGKLMYAVIALSNTGFFRGPTPVTNKIIDRVVALRKENPKISEDGILKKLEKEGLKVSKQEISIILGVYYNYFKK